jgi:hypothetical protein
VAWEKRRGRFFYYRSVRVGNRVKKIYVGRGPAAEQAASEAAEAKARRAAERAEVDEFEAVMVAADQRSATVNEGTKRLVDAGLSACGYHQHRRQWRRRR